MKEISETNSRRQITRYVLLILLSVSLLLSLMQMYELSELNTHKNAGTALPANGVLSQESPKAQGTTVTQPQEPSMVGGC